MVLAAGLGAEHRADGTSGTCCVPALPTRICGDLSLSQCPSPPSALSSGSWLQKGLDLPRDASCGIQGARARGVCPWSRSGFPQVVLTQLCVSGVGGAPGAQPGIPWQSCLEGEVAAAWRCHLGPCRISLAPYGISGYRKTLFF